MSAAQCSTSPAVRAPGRLEAHGPVLAHNGTWVKQHTRGVIFEEFMAGARPLPSFGDCTAACCYRVAAHGGGLCETHYKTWVADGSPRDEAFDAWRARARQPATRRVLSLRGLPELVRLEVLYAIQRRLADQIRTAPENMSGFLDRVRASGVTSVLDFDPAIVDPQRNKDYGRFTRYVLDRVALAYRDPEVEVTADRWDLRVFGRRGQLDFSAIRQDWLREGTKRWAAATMGRVADGPTVQARVRAIGVLSEVLASGPSGGHDPSALGRADIDRFLLRLRSLRSPTTDAAPVGELGGRDSQSVGAGGARGGRDGIPAQSGPDVRLPAGRRPLADPRRGPRQSLARPGDRSARRPSRPARRHPRVYRRAVTPLARRAGRPGRRDGRGRLPAVEAHWPAPRRGGQPAPRLPRRGRERQSRPGLRQPQGRPDGPTPADHRHRTGPAVRDAAALGRRAVPRHPPSRLWLLPRPTRNAAGTAHIGAGQLYNWLRAWVAGIPRIDAGPADEHGDPIPFSRSAITPHAFRHTYAQTLADQGVPAPVLRDLMDHHHMNTTLGYYRVGETKKRDAMELLARHTVDNRGTDPTRSGPASRTGQLREQLSWVAVPMGKCSEPANVRSGGQTCPIRYQCAGCPHFESDPSYLPELNAYANDLRREREASLAMGASSWVIDNIDRQLGVIVEHIRTHEQLLDELPAEQRAASTARQRPSARPDSPCPSRSASEPTTAAVTDNSPALRRARRQDSAMKRQRAVDAIATMEHTGEPISFPAVARRAGVSVSLLYADPQLASRIATARDRQRQAGREGPGGSPPARSSPSKACVPTWPTPKNKHGVSPKKSPSSVTGWPANWAPMRTSPEAGRPARCSTSSSSAPPNWKPTTIGCANSSPAHNPRPGSSPTPSVPPEP